jgi:hypothetical protein
MYKKRAWIKHGCLKKSFDDCVSLSTIFGE